MSTKTAATAVAPTANSYDRTVSIINGTFGAAYFVLQGLADLTCHAEATLVNKVSKGEISVDEAKDYRRATYAVQSESIIARIESLTAKKQ